MCSVKHRTRLPAFFCIHPGAQLALGTAVRGMEDATVPTLQTLALRVVAAHVESESCLEYSLPYGGSVELLESMKTQGRLRGDTLGPLLRASPDELSPVLGSRLTLAAAGCPALRDVCAQRLRCQPEQDRGQMPQGTRQRHTVDRHAGAR